MNRLAACAVLALSLSFTAPIRAQLAGATSAQGELPRTARPSHYTIEVTPDAAALTFAGRETIDLQVLTPTREVVLNSANLAFTRPTLTPAAGGAPITLEATLDEAKQQAHLAAPAELAPGAYRLELAYTGKINRQANGLFALDYPDKRTGKTTRALFTQFEVPSARQFAPMFDEPALKATFDLSAVVPAGQMALSNMPAVREEALGDGTKRVTFATTPKMSSYLLLLAVGDFERVTKAAADGTQAGIVSPAGSGETARYALDAMAELLPYYDAYFGIRFPLPKLDNIAAPGESQTFGAMENWGSILTFEGDLLLDPRNTTPDRQQYIYYAQAHEMAHQWFGDLVTMAWWNDLWLNEGFATWMETKATDHFHPEWSMRVERVNSRERAMALDSLPSSHAVVATIRTAHEADQAFDEISYAKGEAIVSMLEAYAGEDTWRQGVRSYLAAHAYGTAVTADLWRAQEAAGAHDIARVADSFVNQPGVPLVQVGERCAGGRTLLSLKQGEYRRDPVSGSSAPPRHWLVPLTVRSADGSITRHLLDGTTQLSVAGCGPVVVNGGQLGYFRTLYPAAEVKRFAAVLPRLQPIDQLGLVQDNLALASAGNQDFGPALDLLSAVPGNANAVVAAGAAGDWARLYAQVEKPGDRTRFAAVVQTLWEPRLQRMGFDPRPGESAADTKLRAQLLATLGLLGDPAVVAEARRRFAALQQNRTALDGPLKTTWIDIVARNATAAEWDGLRTLGRNAPTSIEKRLYYGALGTASDDALAQRTLDLALTEEPAATARASMIRAVAAHHPDLAFEFALAHESQVNALLDDYSRADFIPVLLASSTNPAMVERLEALRASRPETDRKAADEQLAGLRQRLATIPRIRAQLAAWIAARPNARGEVSASGRR